MNTKKYKAIWNITEQAREVVNRSSPLGNRSQWVSWALVKIDRLLEEDKETTGTLEQIGAALARLELRVSELRHDIKSSKRGSRDLDA